MVTTIDELERRLAELKAQHAATLEAVVAAEAELVPLDRALEAARAVFDEAGTAMARAQTAYAAPNAGHAVHRDQSPDEAERARQEALAAEATFHQAHEELGAALVARNSADLRRSDLSMHGRRIEAAIEQTEAELARARQAEAEPDRDLLATIRAKVLGGLGG